MKKLLDFLKDFNEEQKVVLVSDESVSIKDDVKTILNYKCKEAYIMKELKEINLNEAVAVRSAFIQNVLVIVVK